MQLTKHGIPCNVPIGYRPNPKVKTVKRKRPETQYKHFVELTRYVDGLEETVHVPAKTEEHKQALRDGYKLVRQWTVN